MVIECKKPVPNTPNASDIYGEACTFNGINETDILPFDDTDRTPITETNDLNTTNDDIATNQG